MFSVLYICSDLCTYRDSKPIFCKTNPWRVGLQVFRAKQCVQLQGFVSQHRLPCGCNIHLLPFLKVLLAKATCQPIKYSRDNQYCPTCVSDLFRSAEPETLMLCYPAGVSLSLPNSVLACCLQGWTLKTGNVLVII